VTICGLEHSSVPNLDANASAHDAYASIAVAYLPLNRLELVRDRKLAGTLNILCSSISAAIALVKYVRLEKACCWYQIYSVL
jgi:hypothetical protein